MMTGHNTPKPTDKHEIFMEWRTGFGESSTTQERKLTKAKRLARMLIELGNTLTGCSYDVAVRSDGHCPVCGHHGLRDPGVEDPRKGPHSVMPSASDWKRKAKR